MRPSPILSSRRPADATPDSPRARLIALWNTEYVSAPWHTFIVYIAFTVYAGGINAFGVRILPMFDTVVRLRRRSSCASISPADPRCIRQALVWSLAGLVIVVVVILATARGEFQSASFVWTNWTNNTGWPDGLAFILGLLQSTFGLAGAWGLLSLVARKLR